MKYLVFVVIAIIFAAIGLIAGIKIGDAKDENISSAYELREGGYTFINPLLECEITSGSEINQYVELKYDLEKLIDSAKSNDRVNEVSVYFRDLNLGPWMGINEHKQFSPASLLKLPTMIAFYKHAEADPEILNKKILFD